ncbi:MAG: AAA family ATPase, partial [Rhabdochlamydiaceae bacterium]
MLERIDITNLASYESVHLTGLTKCKMILVYGDNGHGKTALVEALRWVLYGKCNIGSTNSDLIREGQTEANAELEFADLPHRKDTLVVNRTVKVKGSSKATALLNGEVVAS